MLSDWSDEFLDHSRDLIHKIRTIKNYPTISYQKKYILPTTDEKLLLNAFYEVFKLNSEHPLIKRHLNQTQTITTLNIIKNVNISNLYDFHYFVQHLPCGRELQEVLCDYIINFTNIHEIYKKYILGSFVSPVILSWMFKHIKYVSSYGISDGTQIDILHSDNCDTQLNIVGQICHIINIIKQLHKKIQYQKVHIIYIITPFKKRINIFQENQEINDVMIKYLQLTDLKYNYCSFTNPITSLSVNSGVTDSHNHYITIWRSEEFSKVLIHELLHFYSLEKCDYFSSPFVNISNNYPHFPKELFTELQTWYIYIIYRMININNVSNDMVRYYLDSERAHSLTNVAKLFEHFHIRDANQFTGHNVCQMMNVSCSVLYYYIFKAVMLFDTDQILEQLLLPDISTSVDNIEKLSQYTHDKIEHLIKSTRFSKYLKGITFENDRINMMKLT